MSRPELKFTEEGKPIIDQAFIDSRPLSYSSLKHFRKSPKHYVKYLQTPFIPTDATILGSAVDCLALEPENFDKKFSVYEPFAKRTNDAKAKWELMVQGAQANKQTLITKEDFAKAEIMVKALMSHDLARQMIEGKQEVQKRLQWKDKETGLPIIGYVDLDTKVWGEHFAVDLKTTRDGDPDMFSRDAFKMDYHIQAGTYCEGYEKTAYKHPNFAFITVENVEPFNVTVMFCDNKMISQAREEFRGSLMAFKKCLDEDAWSQGYEFRLSEGLDYFSLDYPGYYRPKYLGYEKEK